jgi:hypothetical protein
MTVVAGREFGSCHNPAGGGRRDGDAAAAAADDDDDNEYDGDGGYDYNDIGGDAKVIFHNRSARNVCRCS